MYKIALIVPYFGKFPNYFQLWLNSCKINPTIDWMVYTDDQRHFDYPSNVHVTYTTLQSIKQLAEDKLMMSVNLSMTYKLCDLKVVYGIIFQDDLKEYDFWGYCDVDVIWGNLRRFITDEMLSKYDRIFQWGHCCLMRNVPKINYSFELVKEDVLEYKRVLSSPLYCGFDEEKQIGKLFEKYYKDSYYMKTLCFDVRVSSYRFKKAPSMNVVHDKDIPYLFEFKGDIKGGIYGFYLDNNGTLQKSEFMYVHLQKRRMDVKLSDSLDRCFHYLIIPNSFIDYKELTPKLFKKMMPNSIVYPAYIKRRFNYYIDAIFDNREPRCYERGKLKRFVDKVFRRKIDY